MIEARNLVKIYKPKKGPIVKALDGISIKFASKGMVFVLGKSGSGKSTLLNVLGGLDSIDSGEIIIKGKSAATFKQSDFDSYRNTYIGFIFQEYNILDDFTVGANIALAISLQGRKPTDEEVNKILNEVDLEGYGNRKPNELSGGQKQRVAIARALVKNPEIIMADEPTGALDSATGKQVFETLQKLSKDKLVLIVSHDREFAERYGDRVIELKDGKIIGDDSKETSSLIENNLEDDLTFDNNQIHIKKGYKLTEQDLKQINDYLETLNSNALIDNDNQVSKENRKISNNFKPTDIDKIEMSNEGYSLIKSKLPLKASFKIGASGLKNKKFRLVFTIFLSFIAFTLFGLADTISAYNYEETAYQSIKDSNIDYASFNKYVKHTYEDGSYYYNSVRNMNDFDIQNIKEGTDLYVKGVCQVGKDYSFSNNIAGDSDNLENYQTIFPTTFSGLINLTKEEIEKNYGYSVSGSLPIKDNEIAISKYVATLFTYTNYYKVLDDGEINKDIKVTISKEEDLIGKTLYLNGTNYTITGLVDTGFDYTRYLKINDPISEEDYASLIIKYALCQELDYAQNKSLNGTLFVNENIIKEFANSSDYYFTNIYDYGYINYAKVEELDWDGTTYYDTYSPSNICSDKYLTYPISYFKETTKLNDNEIYVSADIFKKIVEINSNKANYQEYYIDNSLISDLKVSGKINGVSVNSFTFDEQVKYSASEFIDIYKKAIYGKVAYEHLSAYTELADYYEKYVEDITDNKYQIALNYICWSLMNNYEYEEIKLDSNQICTLEKQANDLLVKAFKDYSYLNNNEISYYTYYSPKEETQLFNIVGLYSSNGYGTTYYNNYSMCFSDSFFNLFTNNYEPGFYSYVIGSMPTDKTSLKKIIRFNNDDSKDVKYVLSNPVNYELGIISEILNVLKKVFLWIGLFFAIFATLMLSNFIGTSVNYKKRDIGILRAIGSRSWDVFKIFFSEAFIIALINFTLSVISTGVITLVINNVLREEAGILITVLHFSIRQIGFILLISLFAAFISTLLPVYKHAKKKPIDAIRNR